MGSWRHRILSVIVAAALTGAPTALAACAVVCADHVEHAAPRAGHGPGCAASQAGSRWSAGWSCCPNCEAMPLVSVAAMRADGGVWLAVALATVQAPFFIQKSAALVPLPGPPVAAQSPARAALVLRI